MRWYGIQAQKLEVKLVAAHARVAFFRRQLRRAILVEMVQEFGGDLVDDVAASPPDGGGAAVPVDGEAADTREDKPAEPAPKRVKREAACVGPAGTSAGAKRPV